METQELNYTQYLYLKEVLGVESIFTPNTFSENKTKSKKAKVVLLSAPLSKAEKDLLQKITSAFKWNEFEVFTAEQVSESIEADEIFIFGEEAKRITDKYITTEKAIWAPSLAVLLHDAEAKKVLWQQMKVFMEQQ